MCSVEAIELKSVHYLVGTLHPPIGLRNVFVCNAASIAK